MARATELSQGTSLLIIGVGVRSRLVEFAASMGDVVAPVDIRRDSQLAAQHLASDMLAELPATVAARHLSCDGWRDRELGRLLRQQGCRTLVVVSSDITSLQRRIIKRLTTKSSIELVVV